MSTPPKSGRNDVGASGSSEQDSRNQKVLQNRLKKEFAKQQIRSMQKQREKQFFSQAPIYDATSVISFQNPKSQIPVKDEEIALKSSEAPVKDEEIALKSSEAPVKDEEKTLKVSEAPMKDEEEAMKPSEAPVKDEENASKSSEVSVKNDEGDLQLFEVPVNDEENDLKPSEVPVKDEENDLNISESQKPSNNHKDSKSFPDSSNKLTPPIELVSSGKPRKKKLDTALDFDYNTRNDLIPNAFHPNNATRLSDRPLALYRGSSKALQEKHNRMRNATIKSRFLTDESFLDDISSGRDESKFVTIVPADESKLLDLEFKDWERHRRMFLWLFSAAIFLIIVIIVFTIYSARHFFLQTISQDHRKVFLHFIYHADSMIIGCIFLSAIGMIIFRLFPNHNPKTIVKIHILVFAVVTGCFVWGTFTAFKYHRLVTGVKQHSYTLHAWAGLACAGLGLFSIITGIYLMIYKERSGAMVKYHSSAGMITFIFCGAACVSGYLVRAIVFNGKSYTNFDTKTKLNNSTGGLIIVFILLIRYMSTDFRFRRRAKPEWDTVFGRKVSQYEHTSLDSAGTLEEYVTRITAMSDL